MKRQETGRLNDAVRAYTRQLNEGQLQQAYRGIMAFMSQLKTRLERAFPDYASSAVYPGYLDMTYFALTPPVLKQRNLKIAVVYLHQECRFEVWLAGANRKVQADYVQLLSGRELGRFTLSQVQPGVDAIIASPLIEHPDFDRTEDTQSQIEATLADFIRDIISLLE
ncbi:MAG: hypothetical protein GX600_05810 [Dehalococcoidia bacterium]|jgi:hypothetical protein|nr:hypothetical protein [Dehalococcoidia bacterium]